MSRSGHPDDPVTVWALRALAVVFCALGLICLIRPHLLFAPIGLPDGPPALWAEIRAAYGGFFGTTGLFFGRASTRPDAQGTALWLATFILGGFVLGRCTSWILDGYPANPVAIGNLALEAIGFCVAWMLYRRRVQAG